MKNKYLIKKIDIFLIYILRKNWGKHLGIILGGFFVWHHEHL
jgi:hypothetical protein